MDFFNDLSKRVSNVARAVSEKTKESVEASRLSGDLRAANSALEQHFAELGKAYFSSLSGDDNEAAVNELVGRIREVKARVEELSDQLDEVRDVRRCPGCGAVQPKSARFCASCGKRMPEDAPKPEPQPAENMYCVSCGAQREPGQRFCVVCGQTFDVGAVPSTPVMRPVEDIDSDTEAPVDIDVEEPGADGETASVDAAPDARGLPEQQRFE